MKQYYWKRSTAVEIDGNWYSGGVADSDKQGRIIYGYNAITGKYVPLGLVGDVDWTFQFADNL